MLQKELQLIPEGPMQPDLAVGPPAHLHARLELLLAFGRDRDRQGRAKQRRTTRRLQIGQQVARLLRALVAEVGGALLPVGLRPQDLVCVLNLSPRDSQRQLVGQESRVQGEVNAERQALRRREHQLDPPARKMRLLGQRSHNHLRLPARAQLRLDPQRPPTVLHVAVDPAHDVALERRQNSLAVALEHQRSRFVQPVDLWLAERPAESPAHEPLQLDATRGTNGQEIRQPRVGLVGAHPRALELRDLGEPSIAR